MRLIDADRLIELMNERDADCGEPKNAVDKGYSLAVEHMKYEIEQNNEYHCKIYDVDIKQCGSGWIDVECELPTDSKYILLSFSNFSVPCVGRYEEDENGGAFYIGDEDETCVQQNMFVNAWMPLPETYTKGE